MRSFTQQPRSARPVGKARLSLQERVTLAELAQAVRERFGARVVAIQLFGSRARGEGRDDSDLDVLVSLVALTREDRRFVQDLAFDIGHSRGLVISPLLADPATWRTDLPLGQALAREGLPL